MIIVNQRLAKQWRPGENPIGKTHLLDRSKPRRRSAYDRWSGGQMFIANGLEAQDELAVYLPYAQKTLPFLRWTGFAVRTRSAPAALWPRIREEILHLDADRAIYDVQTTQALVAKSVAEQKFNAMVLAAFAIAALLLSAIGLYGVIAYGVTQRMREFGIRIALGAQSRDVRRLVLRDGVLLTLTGLGLGVVAAFFASKAMAQFLYGVEVHDPDNVRRSSPAAGGGCAFGVFSPGLTAQRASIPSLPFATNNMRWLEGFRCFALPRSQNLLK